MFEKKKYIYIYEQLFCSLAARSLARSFVRFVFVWFRFIVKCSHNQSINQMNQPNKQSINQPTTNQINQSNNYARYLDNQFTLPSTGELFAGRGTANR